MQRAKKHKQHTSIERPRTAADALAELRNAESKDIARLIAEIATRKNLSPTPNSELANLINQAAAHAYSPKSTSAPDRETALRLLDAHLS